jgi:hypothetical protein
LAVLFFLFALKSIWYLVGPETSEPLSARNENRRIAARLEPGSRVLTLTPATGDYGYALRYHGWLITDYYPTANDLWYEGLKGSVQERDVVRFERLSSKFNPAYFAVIGMEGLEAMPELAALLHSRYRIVYQTKRAMVFDLRETMPKGADRSRMRKENG